MEIGVKYLPLVFVFLVSVLVIITLCDLISGTKNLDDYLLLTSQIIQANQTSETIVLTLERCLVSQVMNLLWITISVLVYIKHRQVNDILNRYDMHHRKSLNRSTLQAGLLAAFGSSIMANFQQKDLFYMYCIGKVLFFGCGAIYQCIQTVQYWNLSNVIGQRKTTILRMILSSVSVITFIIFFICTVIVHMQKKNDNYIVKIGVILKWVCAGTTALYLILFHEEFKKITLYEPDVFVEDKVTSSVNTQYANEAFESK